MSQRELSVMSHRELLVMSPHSLLALVDSACVDVVSVEDVKLVVVVDVLAVGEGTRLPLHLCLQGRLSTTSTSLIVVSSTRQCSMYVVVTVL